MEILVMKIIIPRIQNSVKLKTHFEQGYVDSKLKERSVNM